MMDCNHNAAGYGGGGDDFGLVGLLQRCQSFACDGEADSVGVWGPIAEMLSRKPCAAVAQQGSVRVLSVGIGVDRPEFAAGATGGNRLSSRP